VHKVRAIFFRALFIWMSSPFLRSILKVLVQLLFATQSMEYCIKILVVCHVMPIILVERTPFILVLGPLLERFGHHPYALGP